MTDERKERLEFEQALQTFANETECRGERAAAGYNLKKDDERVDRFESRVMEKYDQLRERVRGLEAKYTALREAVRGAVDLMGDPHHASYDTLMEVQERLLSALNTESGGGNETGESNNEP